MTAIRCWEVIWGGRQSFRLSGSELCESGGSGSFGLESTQPERGHDGAVGDGDKYQEPAYPFSWTQWYVAKKTTDFHTPGPSDVWVFRPKNIPTASMTR